MILDNAFLSPFDATLIDRKFTNHEVVNINDWLEGSNKPIFFREYTRFKGVDLTFLIKADDDAVMESNFANLVEKLKFATIAFTDMSKIFDVHMEGTTQLEKLMDGSGKFTISLLCHKTYLPKVAQTISNVTNVTIINAGNLEAPMVITIVPTATINQLTIQGLSRLPIAINYLSAGSTYVINGETYKYTQDGVSIMDNFDSYEFPILPKDGANILLSNANLEVTFEYNPRFN